MLERLPAPFDRHPGTWFLVGVATTMYVAVAAATQGTGFLASSAYTLRHFGATDGPSMLMGQWWRVVTSLFLHHDLLHLAFNMQALLVIGRSLEQVTDGRRVFGLFVLTGAASMAGSSAWYGWISPALGNTEAVLAVSAGASGAICGLLGAAWVAARRLRSPAPVRAALERWAVFILLFGLVVPGVNNVAHAVGLATGVALGWRVPLGPLRSRRGYTGETLGAALLMSGVLTAFVFAALDARGEPAYLAHDGEAATLAGFEVRGATRWENSDQVRRTRLCLDAAAEGSPTTRERCDDARRALAFGPTYAALARVAAAEGDAARAARYARVAAALPRGE
ncbi:MAG: rhomboid family intramembrane serine protease [Myxococcales bacterium]|nr:rhomboid family intramembrane serine protease [Myxococcales bacterium]